MLAHIFVDRSLGAIKVPQLLREAGVELTTMREYYGEEVAQQVDDIDWIIEIAAQGWIGFHKDDNIRRNEVERQTVIDHGAKLFSVNPNISGEEAARRFITHLRKIEAAAASPGPFMYAVRLAGLERLL